MALDVAPRTSRSHTVAGVTFLLVLMHGVPLVLGWFWGWPWAVGGVVLVVMVLTFCTLYPHCSVFGSATRRLPVSDRSVILTIDDGPCSDTGEILSILAEYRVKAAFFLIGKRAEKHPEDVRLIVEAGHIVGNHTYSHAAYWYWSFPAWVQRREVQQCQDVLAAITGRVPTLFRAPAGLRNPYCNLVASELGLAVTGWQTRGFDGVMTPIPKILESLRAGLRPGAIILLHQGMPHSTELLRRFLAMLEDGGWSTTIPQAWLTPASVETPPTNY